MFMIPVLGLGGVYAWKATSNAQQFDQRIDKVNPIITTQNVALGNVDSRILNSGVRKRHGNALPEFFAKPTAVLVHKQPRLYDPPANMNPSSNYNRAYITARKTKRMTPRHVQKMKTTNEAILETDRMSHKLYKIDTSSWPY